MIDKLKKGDIIGIVCPSHIGSRERYERDIYVIESLGFRVKMGKNVYENTYGYSASEKQRADDFNDMVSDNEVKMVLFGGGEGGNELFEYLDFENMKKNLKFYCSFSDGTSILNAIYSKTGLVTHYGQSPGMFYDLRHYDYLNFANHFIEKNEEKYIMDSQWKTLNSGVCEGILVGGYIRNFALLLGSDYFNNNKNKKYILFLEDFEKFNSIAKVSSYLTHIEQNKFCKNISGLIFGHYSDNDCPDLYYRLERFGQKLNIPVVYTDDFGHGNAHAIFPIGRSAIIDADEQTLKYK